MVNEKSWTEFRETGLFWFINTTLHMFGWALVAVIDGDVIVKVYPARCKFRGFSEEINDQGYQKVSTYLKNNIEELHKEAHE